MKIDSNIFDHCSKTLYDDTKKNEGYTIVEMDFDNNVAEDTNFNSLQSALDEFKNICMEIHYNNK